MFSIFLYDKCIKAYPKRILPTLFMDNNSYGLTTKCDIYWTIHRFSDTSNKWSRDSEIYLTIFLYDNFTPFYKFNNTIDRVTPFGSLEYMNYYYN